MKPDSTSEVQERAEALVWGVEGMLIERRWKPALKSLVRRDR